MTPARISRIPYSWNPSLRLELVGSRANDEATRATLVKGNARVGHWDETVLPARSRDAAGKRRFGIHWERKRAGAHERAAIGRGAQHGWRRTSARAALKSRNRELECGRLATCGTSRVCESP